MIIWHKKVNTSQKATVGLPQTSQNKSMRIQNLKSPSALVMIIIGQLLLSTPIPAQTDKPATPSAASTAKRTASQT